MATCDRIARQIVLDIEVLRQHEGAGVMIVCDNPECDAAERTTYVEVCGPHTGWRAESVYGVAYQLGYRKVAAATDTEADNRAR